MPQNQRTEPTELDELPLLNEQEEKLVEAIALGHSNTEAYRMAYGAEGYGANALAVQASRKIAQPKIQAHLRALRSVGHAKTALNLEECVKDELAFAERAEMAGNFGAAGGARDRRNKLLGLYIDKVQDVTERVDPVQTLKEIESLMGAEYAAQVAARYGIEWAKPEGESVH